MLYILLYFPFLQVVDRKKSPFCIGRPIFTLAEPDDLEIICGEFSTDVEIIDNSKEPEQVFKVKKIINHPRYQPNRVRKIVFIFIIDGYHFVYTFLNTFLLVLGKGWV